MSSTKALAGKIGLVTGSSRGIGYGCALEMARAGADVVINYLDDESEAKEVVRELEALGVRALCVQGDVAREEDIQNLVDKTVDAFGKIDLFVSNAAYSDRELMIKANMAGFRKTIDVCMWGAFYGVRAASIQMVKQGQGGSIVVIGSPHAEIPLPGAMAYNMAKAATDQMARTAAIELAEHRIRVNIVHPGWTNTPGERKFYSDEELMEGAKKIPWKRLGQPEEIGRAAVFLLSEEYTTGSTVLIDGGISLPWWAGQRVQGKVS